MALVQISYVIQDADGDKSALNIGIPSGTLTLAEIVGFAEDFAVLLDAVTDGLIAEMHLVIGIDVPEACKDNPVALSEVQFGGLLSFTVDGSDYRYSARIPAMQSDMFVGDIVDKTEEHVLALITAFEDGIIQGATPVEPCNRYELDLVTYIEGIKSFRRK